MINRGGKLIGIILGIGSIGGGIAGAGIWAGDRASKTDLHATNTRVTVIEIKQENTDKQVGSVDRKIDIVIEQLNQLGFSGRIPVVAMPLSPLTKQAPTK